MALSILTLCCVAVCAVMAIVIDLAAGGGRSGGEVAIGAAAVARRAPKAHVSFWEKSDVRALKLGVEAVVDAVAGGISFRFLLSKGARTQSWH